MPSRFGKMHTKVLNSFTFHADRSHTHSQHSHLVQNRKEGLPWLKQCMAHM